MSGSNDITDLPLSFDRLRPEEEICLHLRLQRSYDCSE